MDISVIICTYNRAQQLKETLQSFLQLDWGKDISYELLVVDNNSRDNTKDVVAEFIKQNPFIKYVFEKKVGLSHARNRGVMEAKGEIIAFTDDDVYFDVNLGYEIIKAFKQYPDVWSVGGKNIPVFLEGKPIWINDDFLPIYGDVKMGEEERYFEFPSHPYGLNMSFRREVFGKVGMFNTELGRRKNNLFSNDETGLYYKISRHNLKVLYSPFVIVKHKVPACRTQKKWILKRNYWQGISDVIFEQMISSKPKGALLSEAYKDIKRLKKEFKREILCDFKKPLKVIYWHIKGIKLERWAYHCHKIGRIRQKLLIALTLKPLRRFYVQI